MHHVKYMYALHARYKLPRFSPSTPFICCCYYVLVKAARNRARQVDSACRRLSADISQVGSDVCHPLQQEVLR